ncbi:response regulator transcription factor [Microvirga mediterraneensis]|uniref:Response regulator transcription factor n=1 Tax=Microvirga mediterraneensis TaxID=2754695 RepID=A0A838BMH5_9HYPH|nr:response regulator transcription factor [Microvirga mediterraneensis]MBA1156541.1 response regulator transcription factor [Microvirga mediterraneensis]
MRIGLIADDDSYFRMAVSAILTTQLGFSQIIEAGSLNEALELLDRNSDVSVALLDLSMPGMTTLTNLRMVRENFPNARVAVVSGSQSRRDILSSLEAGVHGYVPKSLSVAELTGALRAVLEGNLYVPSLLADVDAISEEEVHEKRGLVETDEADPVYMLTRRQQEVLELLIKGKSNKEIALALKLGEGTVKVHLAAIFRHFGVNNRAAAAVAATRAYLGDSHSAHAH